MNKAQVFLRKHSSTILTVVGAAGVVATSVLAVKATPKALLLLEEAEYQKGEELTAIETVKAAWKPYIPAVITGASTIACIFGINYLSTRNQATLMSAYAVLDRSYKEYREKVNELYGESSDLNVKQEIVKSKYINRDEDFDVEGEGELFFDYEGVRWFRSTVEKVREAEYKFNQNLTMSGFACINEFYDILGIERTESGYQLGWSTVTNDDIYGHSSFEVELEKTTMEGGMECWIMTMPCSPTLDYMY